MNAVGPIDVREARWSEHDGIARRQAAERMRRRVGVVIGLDLNDHTTGAIEEEGCADQVGRDLMHGAVEERAIELSGHAMIYRDPAAKGEGPMVRFLMSACSRDPFSRKRVMALSGLRAPFRYPERDAITWERTR